MTRTTYTCDCEVVHEDVVNAVYAKMPQPLMLEQLSSFFKAFADPTRLRILWALQQDELCVCDLAVLLGMTKSAISHQLRFLREAELVRFRKEGKNAYYTLNDEHINKLITVSVEHVSEKDS